MADADEDAIPRSDPSANNIHNLDYDPEDEAQDFRFLASLTGANASLPKRGEKDFEPNPTKAQQNVLNASRKAMHNALAVERVHPPKTVCVGVYLPNPKEWWYDIGSEGSAPSSRCVVVEKFRGGHSKTLGKEDYRNWTWLLPEEALYLIERGSLDIRWPDEGRLDLIGKVLIDNDEQIYQDNSIKEHHKESPQDGSEEKIRDEQNGNAMAGRRKTKKYQHTLHIGETPMSLQGAYACLIGKSGLTLERYSVYVGLKRLGYILQRALTWDEQTEMAPEHSAEENSSEVTDTSSDSARTDTILIKSLVKNVPVSTSLINRLLSWLQRADEREQYNTAIGPLIKPGIYRNYNDIFRTLNIITSISPPSESLPLPPPPPTSRPERQATIKSDVPLKIHYQVNKPTPAYRKSAPPLPDFQICIINARTTPSIPTLGQLNDLLDSLEADNLPAITNKNGQQVPRRIEAKLKHGRRNVILAIVDCGVVSYLRFADMGFSELGKVYEEKARRGTKGRSGGARGGHGGGSRRASGRGGRGGG